MKYDILIFVQASADLRYALSIYEQNRGKHIYICVVNVNLVYNFIKGLPLENTIVKFYPYVYLNNYNPFTYLKAKRELKAIWVNEFKPYKYNQVYFFSRFYDWFTAGILGNILKNKKSEIFYYEHYDDASIKNDIKIIDFTITGFKAYLVSKIISYVSNVKFSSTYKIRSVEFNFWEYEITKIKANLNSLIAEKFLFEIKSVNKQSVLFFLSPVEIDMLTIESVEKLKNFLIDLKKNNFHLILKGHPRLGNTMEYEKYFDLIVPNYIPSEFISYASIDVVFGILSSGLNYIFSFPNIKVISILDMLEFKLPEKKLFYEKFLIELSENKIAFIKGSDFRKYID